MVNGNIPLEITFDGSILSRVVLSNDISEVAPLRSTRLTHHMNSENKERDASSFLGAKRQGGVVDNKE